MDNSNNGCETCKYYYAHYVKGTIGYSRTTCGHCAKNAVKKPQHPLLHCPHWEKAETRNAEQRQTLKKTLIRICNQLNAIAEVLREEETQ